MNRSSGFILLAAVCLVVVAAADERNPSGELDPFRINQLISYLVEDKDMSKLEFHSHTLSVQYRLKVIRALARFLISNYDLKNIRKPGGKLNFETAWSRCKKICIQVKALDAMGAKPKNIDKDVWDKLIKIIQYIMENKMLLQDQIYGHLTA